MRRARASILVLLMCIAPTIVRSADKDPGKTQARIGPNHIYRVLYGKYDRAELQKLVDGMRKLPLYERISYVQVITEYLIRDDRMEDLEVAWQEGQHDLRRIPGRAAFLLEGTLRVRLPRIVPDSSEAELKEVFAQAGQLVSVYRLGAVEASSESCSDKRIEELKKMYRGGIKTGDATGQDIDVSERILRELLEKIFPIGKKLSLIEEVVGEKAKVSQDGTTASYAFIGGFVSTGVTFVIEDGVVVSVLPFCSQ